MKGSFKIKVKPPKMEYNISVDRKISVILGDSATGKSILFRMISDSGKKGIPVEIESDVDVIPLNEDNWDFRISKIKEKAIFVMDENPLINTREFCKMVNDSECYFIFITREDLSQYSISANSLYTIDKSNGNIEKIFKDDFIYSKNDKYKIDSVVVEDSGSGFLFYRELFNVDIKTSNGKGDILKRIEDGDKQLFLVDGSAIGNDILEISTMLREKTYSSILFPDSFEYVLLSSGLFEDSMVESILDSPENFIDYKYFQSRERFYYNLIKEISGSKDYKRYSKSKLNSWYTLDKNILKVKKFFKNKLLFDIDSINCDKELFGWTR